MRPTLPDESGGRKEEGILGCRNKSRAQKCEQHGVQGLRAENPFVRELLVEKFKS